MILGLDISTSITGYTILDENNKIIEIGHWDTKNKNHFPSLFLKAAFIKEKLNEIAEQHAINNIFIEPALNMFMMGKSSSHTISTLTKFNGIISWLCYEKFGITPEYIPAISARKKCGITIKRGEKAKEQVMRFLLDKEPLFEVEYTRHGNPKAGYADRSDSYVIAKAGWLNERQEAQNTD